MKKVLAKISGEYFDNIHDYVPIIKDLMSHYRLIFMCGGGNWIRGRDSDPKYRAHNDRIGMMSTIANAIKLAHALNDHDIRSTVFSTIQLDLTEPYNLNKIADNLDAGDLPILAGGLGCGYISTDTAMVVRGLELGCEMVLKLTKVGGVYDKDPKHALDAKIIHKMSYEEALTKNAFDKSAICIAMEHKLPFAVVDFANLANFLGGHTVGTLVG